MPACLVNSNRRHSQNEHPSGSLQCSLLVVRDPFHDCIDSSLLWCAILWRSVYKAKESCVILSCAPCDISTALHGGIQRSQSDKILFLAEAPVCMQVSCGSNCDYTAGHGLAR